MTGERTGPALYWSSGGAIMTGAGALSLARSLALFEFYGREAGRRRRLGDRLGGRHCALKALELAGAIVEADDWRCAARGAGRSKSELSALRALTRDLKRPAYG